jgi:hypothetical protein
MEPANPLLWLAVLEDLFGLVGMAGKHALIEGMLRSVMQSQLDRVFGAVDRRQPGPPTLSDCLNGSSKMVSS